MIRRPPRSTLFPTRRSSDLPELCYITPHININSMIGRVEIKQAGNKPRSEEHTSELQSRLHLVCRLLLEKKKKVLRLSLPLTVAPAESADPPALADGNCDPL